MIVKKAKKTLGISAVFALILVLLDQLTKILAVCQLKDKEPFVIINNIFEFRYLENQSAAFGIDLVTIIHKIFNISYFNDNPSAFLRAKMIFFAVVTIIVVILLCLLYSKIPETKKFKAINILLVFFIAGAIGNLIDRIVNNYVVDFLYFKLIDFPIFNVADIYVTVAAILFIVLGIFYYKEEDIEEVFPSKKKGKN